MEEKPQKRAAWRERLYVIIFEADTPPGKQFDIILLWAILLSIVVVMLETVQEVEELYGPQLKIAEWIFTLVFTAEYVLRIVSARKPLRYIFSFYGLVDLISIVPTYLSLILIGGQYLMVVRGLRLLRIFRILKLSRFLGEADVLKKALKASYAKIIVFIGVVLTVVIIIGALMYLIEGPEYGFSSIPRSVYWAIVTLTTVGYGDIAPSTTIGQTLAAFVMILGYGIIAVPTGIMTVELGRAERSSRMEKVCPSCNAMEHDIDAAFCKHCGTRLNVVPKEQIKSS